MANEQKLRWKMQPIRIKTTVVGLVVGASLFIIPSFVHINGYDDILALLTFPAWIMFWAAAASGTSEDFALPMYVALVGAMYAGIGYLSGAFIEAFMASTKKDLTRFFVGLLALMLFIGLWLWKHFQAFN